MASESPRSRSKQAIRPALQREVLTPGREQTGLAVVLVAASALAFALAGSAFALWARTAAQHCDHNHFTPAVSIDADEGHARTTNPHATTAHATHAAHATVPCSSQLVEHHGVSYYRVCPDPDVAIQPAHEFAVEEHEGMVVFRIVK